MSSEENHLGNTKEAAVISTAQDVARLYTDGADWLTLSAALEKLAKAVKKLSN